MIKFIHANVLEVNAVVIAHQANCRCTMGAGVAKAIADKWPEVAKDESKTMRGIVKFGTCHISKPLTGPPFIVHLYGQLGFGTSKQQTDYAALGNAIKRI